MQIASMVLALCLTASTPQAQEAQATAVDFDALIEEAAVRVVAEDLGATVRWVVTAQHPRGDGAVLAQARDPETGRFVAASEEGEGDGYWAMMYGNSYDPAVLAFMAASAFEMYTASDLRGLCDASENITCTDPFPGTVMQDAIVSAGVYAGVTALQRLAKTQWDVDLDDGWKNVLIWGGITGVRALLAAKNMSDANALREFGR